jgi:hypothetical protein
VRSLSAVAGPLLVVGPAVPTSKPRNYGAGPAHRDFGPQLEIRIKSFFKFPIFFNSVQASEIHIYSNIDPKMMKLVLLDS